MTKSFVVQLLLVMLLSLVSVVVMPTYASQSDVPAQFSADKDYHTNVANARSMLQARGYQVKNIKAKFENSQRYLEVEALKGASQYEIKLYYPDLKIAKEKLNK